MLNTGCALVLEPINNRSPCDGVHPKCGVCYLPVFENHGEILHFQKARWFFHKNCLSTEFGKMFVRHAFLASEVPDSDDEASDGAAPASSSADGAAPASSSADGAASASGSADGAASASGSAS